MLMQRLVHGDRGAPADAITLDLCLFDWKFTAEFFGLIKHMKSYFFLLHLIFFWSQICLNHTNDANSFSVTQTQISTILLSPLDLYRKVLGVVRTEQCGGPGNSPRRRRGLQRKAYKNEKHSSLFVKALGHESHIPLPKLPVNCILTVMCVRAARGGGV